MSEIWKENLNGNVYRTRQLFEELQLIDKKDKRICNIVGMDGGKFHVEREELFNRILYAKDVRNIKMLSPVYQIENKTFCWMDVDYLENESIENFQKICSNFLNEKYDELFRDYYYITKNRSKNRFHVYYPDIILTKTALKILWDQINDEFKKKIKTK